MSIESRYVELHPTSLGLHQRAMQVFPDGVTHDTRRTSPFPLYVAKAAGSRKTDVDGNEIIDYVMGHGALLLGHLHPAIMGPVEAQARLGTHYGASHEAEVRWGELVQGMVPSAERLRFTSSGTEATMMALRLARARSGREKILRLREHFHGWNDSVTGQPAAEETLPVSAGLPRGILDASIVIPPNDIDAIERTMREDGGLIAAMILEPTGAHWGTEPIGIDYVRRARELTAELGIVLIFDEVITGFRVSPGGAQQAYGITPDMTTLAKIIAGGLPGACVAGRADLVEQIASSAGESERIAHPGTFNANPLSAAAGVACLELIGDGKHQERAAATAATLARAMNAVLREESVAGAVYGVSSMLHVALAMEQPPPDGYSWGWHALPSTPPRVPPAAFKAFRLGMLNEGIDLMDGDGMMVSSVHDADDVARTVAGFRAVVREMRVEGVV
ncbi:MAG: aminotransferase class III-fold pyridoxal phosphate-dependent enzyme [Chloroflexota bacterium]|nr:aminotransferase class III-fold pyridoxal phosphate-dependent enzyme [Chloroflexota bacterium]